MDSEMMEKQVKSKQRVADRGEVFTAEREVKAMCDLVAQECDRIDSRFLEVYFPIVFTIPIIVSGIDSPAFTKLLISIPVFKNRSIKISFFLKFPL